MVEREDAYIFTLYNSHYMVDSDMIMYIKKLLKGWKLNVTINGPSSCRFKLSKTLDQNPEDFCHNGVMVKTPGPALTGSQ